MSRLTYWRRWITLSLAAAVLTLTACNTVEGVGEDLEALGENMSDAADGAENND